MSHHAGKPPPEDAKLFFLLVLLFGIATAYYMLLKNWVMLAWSVFQCGVEC